ncbi:hypothetical protein GOB48_27175 [Sinorhizobium meliloti]|nr:hypothetical protein [Sinorhizobium meliloti]
MTTVYCHRNSYREDTTTHYGRWSYNKNVACRDQGYGQSYLKSHYSDPIDESCASGGPIKSMTLLTGITDPMLDDLKKNDQPE